MIKYKCIFGPSKPCWLCKKRRRGCRNSIGVYNGCGIGRADGSVEVETAMEGKTMEEAKNRNLEAALWNAMRILEEKAEHLTRIDPQMNGPRGDLARPLPDGGPEGT